jgi:hypothetical protein
MTTVVFLAVAGCGFSEEEGPCPPEGTGEIACYSVPAPGDTWRLDCNHPLDRTYWRIFEQSDGTAYLMPRPDGQVLDVCVPIFQQYGLCDSALDAAGVERINAMPLDDARALSHALHENLAFRVEGTAIVPWPLPEDLEVVCPGTSAAGACEDYLEVVCGNSSLGVELALDEAQAAELAAALNASYGIDG